MSLKAISLFTGAGGLDYGFEAAGFKTAAAVELDATCCETLRANRSWPVICGDIGMVPTAAILEVAKLCAGEPDVLIGGPPCQPFSKSGYWASGDSRRLLDPRASTLGGYMRVLREARPRAFLLENVEGLGFRGKDEGLRQIMSELEDINQEHGTSYRPFLKVVNAADYGVPQIRRRLIIVGARDGSEFSFPAATHSPLTDEGECLERWTTAWDAIHDVPEVSNEDLSLRGKWADLLPSIPEGENYLWHTDRGGGQPLFGWRTRYWCFLLKLAKDRPAWTIQAQPGPATGPFHWANRRLSMRELARLQTFPDDVAVKGTIGVAHKQLGNAVPSLLAEVLARQIRTQLLRQPLADAELKLAVKRAPEPPKMSQVESVPPRYLALRGRHASHPGTGQGPGALQRANAAA